MNRLDQYQNVLRRAVTAREGIIFTGKKKDETWVRPVWDSLYEIIDLLEEEIRAMGGSVTESCTECCDKSEDIDDDGYCKTCRTCRSEDCDEPNTGGEGYNGYCGNCADQLEEKGHWN